MSKYHVKYEGATLSSVSIVKVLSEREIVDEYCYNNNIEIDDMDDNIVDEKYRNAALDNFNDDDYIGYFTRNVSGGICKYELYMLVCDYDKIEPIFIDSFDTKEIADKYMLQMYSDYKKRLPFKVTGISRGTREEGYYPNALPYMNGKSTISDEMKNKMENSNVAVNIGVIMCEYDVIKTLDFSS